MSEPVAHSRFRIPLYLLLFISLLAGAVYGGLSLGRRAAEIEESNAAPLVPQQSVANQTKSAGPPTPLFFFVKNPSDADMGVVADQVRLAADAGVHRVVLGAPLPWEAQDVDLLFKRITTVVQANSKAGLWLFVRLDPPDAWLRAHSGDAYQGGEASRPMVSLASTVWRQEVLDRLDRLVGALRKSESGQRVRGLMLGCLEDGWWQYPQGMDMSEANKTAFRAWITTRYPDDAALQKAWGRSDVVRASVEIPAKPVHEPKDNVFMIAPEFGAWRDCLQYGAETLSGTILGVAQRIKDSSAGEIEVIVPYGFAFEQARNDIGHFSLQALLEGPIDGFACPVTYVDRGLGGVGGPMGPVDSAALYGKQWYLVDDTRTGVEKDPLSGAITHIKGLRPDDVFSVHARNFSLALTHGMGVMWTDPDGMGWLDDPQLWERFSFLQKCYAEHLEREAEAKGRSESHSAEWPGESQVLTVVVDEAVRFQQHSDAKINEVLLPQVRDAAMCAGVSLRFVRLRDVLDGKAAASAAYLFANAFALSPADRETLQKRFVQEKAVAIWMYAPGYLDPAASLEGVKAVTRMDVAQFDGPAQSGSAYSLEGGAWIAKGTEIGAAQTWTPLFSINAEGADVLANYRESGKPSIGIKFFPEGWTSVLVAEPALPASLLREILRIAGVRLCVKEAANLPMDCLTLGHGYLAIHARGSGERIVDMGLQADIEDLLDPSVMWKSKSSFVLSLKTGRTRLLKVTPSGTGEGEIVEGELAPTGSTGQ